MQVKIGQMGKINWICIKRFGTSNYRIKSLDYQHFFMLVNGTESQSTAFKNSVGVAMAERRRAITSASATCDVTGFSPYTLSYTSSNRKAKRFLHFISVLLVKSSSLCFFFSGVFSFISWKGFTGIGIGENLTVDIVVSSITIWLVAEGRCNLRKIRRESAQKMSSGNSWQIKR